MLHWSRIYYHDLGLHWHIAIIVMDFLHWSTNNKHCILLFIGPKLRTSRWVNALSQVLPKINVYLVCEHVFKQLHGEQGMLHEHLAFSLSILAKYFCQDLCVNIYFCSLFSIFLQSVFEEHGKRWCSIFTVFQASVDDSVGLQDNPLLTAYG